MFFMDLIFLYINIIFIFKNTLYMKKILTEAQLGLVKSQMGEYPIAKVKGFIDWDLSKRIRDTFNMKYNPKEKFFFWFLDKTDQQKTIDKYIKPALEFINTIKDTSGLEFEIDELIQALNNPAETIDPEVELSEMEKEQIMTKLQLFKERLVMIGDDEQFKETMAKLIKFKGAQGYTFSLINSLLIMVQNPNATNVNNEKNWLNFYNRKIKEGAKALGVWKPKGKSIRPSKEERDELTKEYIRKLGKKSFNELTPNEKIKLQSKLRGKINSPGFEIGPVFDVSDTVQIEGKEDFITGAKDAMKDVQWYEEDMIDEKVRPIYKSLVDYCEDNGINIEYADDLGGARGSSAGGKINLLKNEGNDVGTTKTFVHEIAHELLHQTYLKGVGKGEFFVGRDIGTHAIEQQAEISAWMFMYSFGFDLKTTSLNYAIMWGGNPSSMVTVFDTVSKMVNHLIDYVNTRIAYNKSEIDESKGSFNHGAHISPDEIAKLLGVEKQYKEVLDHAQNKDKEELYERIIKKVLK
jgi:hypothetical protein